MRAESGHREVILGLQILGQSKIQHKIRKKKKKTDAKKSRNPSQKGWAANLPTCFREARNQHAKNGATGTRHPGTIHRARECFLTAWSTSKLYGESLAFEITAICWSPRVWLEGGGSMLVLNSIDTYETLRVIILAIIYIQSMKDKATHPVQHLWHPMHPRTR